MSQKDSNRPEGYLERLPPEFYRGQAYVHWTMTIENRATGWLVPIVYYKFRELLTHTMFRFGLSCPVYCCMPDHIHLFWMGLLDLSDQLLAAKYFRKHLNSVLETMNVRLQSQAYDHVLKEKEIEKTAIEDVGQYIATNPERKRIVAEGQWHKYKFTDCLVPGYPDIHFQQTDYWDRFWRITAYIRKNGLVPP